MCSQMRLLAEQTVAVLKQTFIGTGLEELGDVGLHQKRNVAAYALDVPIPPAQAQELANDVVGKAHAHESCRVSGNDGVRRHVAADHGAGGDHGAVADGHAGQDQRPMPIQTSLPMRTSPLLDGCPSMLDASGQSAIVENG